MYSGAALRPNDERCTGCLSLPAGGAAVHEDELDRVVLSEAERVAQVVKQMSNEGFAPAVLVFLRADGRVRTVFRDGLDVNAVLRSALDSPAPEIAH